MSDSSAAAKVTTASAVDRPRGAATQSSTIRRRAANAPNSARQAGAGGSNQTMLQLYTDDADGMKVDPVFVIVLSLGFIGSIFFLHIAAKVVKAFVK